MAKRSNTQAGTSLRQKIFLIVSGILFSLIFLEIGLRISGFVYSSINKLPQDKGANYRVFCLGESTTFGIGAANPAINNYPHQLEKLLNEKYPHLQAQCFYADSIGFNTTENLIKLPAHIKKYKPHLVIFMAGLNNWYTLDKSNILIFTSNKFFSNLFIRFSVFLDQFKVYKFLKLIAYSKGLIKLRDKSKWPGAGRENKLNTEILERGKNSYKSVADKYDVSIFDKVAFYDLREMVRICQDQQIKVIICSYPEMSAGEGLYYVQKRISSLFNCPFVDNYLIFKNLTNRSDYLSLDSMHPNEKGYRLVAENIYNCILKNKLAE